MLNDVSTPFSASEFKLDEFGRFIVVGSFSVLQNTAIIVILTELFALHYLMSFVVCSALVNGTAFLLNRQWSFRRKGKVEWIEPLRYSAVVVGALAVAMAISWGLVKIGVPYFAAVGISACALAPVNFFLHKFWSFGERRTRGTVDGVVRKPFPPPYEYAECPSRTTGLCKFGSSPLVSLETAHPLAPRVDIYQCKACGHGVTRPPMPDVAPLYEGRNSQDFLARDRKWVRLLKQWHNRQICKWIYRHAGERPALAIDFGTGNGALAAALAEAWPQTRVVGVDFFDDPPAEIGTAEYRSIAASRMLEGQADILTCFHVLEHDDNPHALLARLLSFLKPGGTLVIEVPNVQCVWTPWFGTSCENWYAPFHRVHFSGASLRALVESNGLKIVGEADVCGPTFAMSLARLLGVRPNGFLFALSLALRPFQYASEKLTGRPSAMRLACRR